MSTITEVKTNENSVLHLPEAFIATYDNKTGTKNRSKIHQTKFGKTVYLNNNDEFIFELFNPKKKSVLVKIQIQGSAVTGNGIILKPGERSYLLGDIIDCRSFKFETYKVGDSPICKNAISDNGNIKIEFFNELEFNIPYIPYIPCEPYIHPYYPSPWTQDPWMWPPNPYNNNRIIYKTNTNFSLSVKNIDNNSGNIKYVEWNNANIDINSVESNTDINNSESKIETGIVSKGKNTNQIIKQTYCDFGNIPFRQIEYKILPVSNKVDLISDIKAHLFNKCEDCGSRIKRKFKFCPNCGKKNS